MLSHASQHEAEALCSLCVAMAKKKPTSKRKNKSGQSWLSPTYGYDVAYRDYAIRLKLFHDHKTEGEIAIIKAILRGIREFYGEHTVGGLASHRRGKPLEIGIWKERQHSYHVRAPISTVRDSTDWQALADVEADPLLLLSAERGTGDKRHYVWSLARSGYWQTDTHATISLFLSLRHLRHAQLADLERLIDELFTLSIQTGACRSAFAEPCLAWHYEGWGMNEAQAPRLGSEWPDKLWSLIGPSRVDYVRDICWKLVLSPVTLEPFDGVAGFRDRYREVCSRVLSGWQWTPPVPKEIDGYAIHSLAPLTDVIDDEESRPDTHALHTAAAATAMVLGAKQRLLVQCPNLFERFSENQSRLDQLQAERMGAETPDLDVADLDRIVAHVRDHPPSCIAGRGVLIEHDDDGAPSVPTGRHPDNHVSFRVGLDPKQSFTVYGRMSRSTECLWGLVLVGSLKRDRAAFVFDAGMHGWDGYNPDRPPEDAYSADRATGRLSQFKCPNCDGRHFRLVAEFEFSDETPEPFQEHFTWFTLVGECVGCNWAGTVADHECA